MEADISTQAVGLASSADFSLINLLTKLSATWPKPKQNTLSFFINLLSLCGASSLLDFPIYQAFLLGKFV